VRSVAIDSTAMRTVAVLFADRDSIYKTLPGVDVYDVDRDARTFPGGMPVVAHPPCRLWGNVWANHPNPLQKPDPQEKDLALFAVDAVRRCGGVLEHPASSRLWKHPFPAWIPCPEGCENFLCTIHHQHAHDCQCPEIDGWNCDPYTDGNNLPPLGSRDAHGGFILPVLQWWWGHRAEKATRLYIIGLNRGKLPEVPFRIGEPTHVVTSGYSHGGKGHQSKKPEVSKRERSATPPAFAEWLVEVARRTKV